VLRWWESDRAASKQPLYSDEKPLAEVEVKRALFLLREGQLSMACKRLVSLGLGDLADQRVVDQLAQKHPDRMQEVPESLEQFGPFRHLHVNMRDTLRGLARHAGTGVSGFRNEYLVALTEEFVDARAAEVIPLLDAFAERYVNAELPPWFYALFSRVKRIAPIKALPSEDGEVPDVRPLGIGKCLKRAIHSAVMVDFKEPLAQHFWPQQVAVGEPGGLSILIFGVRAMLEANPDWIVVKVDVRNAYNEIKRAKVFQRLEDTPSLRAMLPLFWATYRHSSEIALATAGLPVAEFASSEGMQQDDGLASAGFCVGIYPEVRH
jgi:hypothetical protein